MASQPYQPPQTILLGQFKGWNNLLSPERLQQGDLAVAQDVVLDDGGQLRDRGGFAKLDTDDYHSCQYIAGRYFVVKNGVLGVLAADFTHTPIATAGDDPVSYTEIDGTVYASSISWSAKISPTLVPSTWCVDNDPGQWISPVMSPSDVLGEVAGRQLAAPPLASIVENYKGRIYLAVGKMLWITELYLYDLVDKTKGFVQFDAEITMIRSVATGVFVGTTKGVYFLQGTAAEGLKAQQIMDVGVLRGSDTTVPLTKLNPAGRQQPMAESISPVFMTPRGACYGTDTGDAINLTVDRVAFPALTRGAALYRNDVGASIYVYADAAGDAFAVNTLTGAVTRYGNYTFVSFMPFHDGYLGATPDGLYTIGGDDDDGVPIGVLVRTGLMRFGGTLLSRLKAAYISGRLGPDLTLTVITGNSVTYIYAVPPVDMATARIDMGKGQRATLFAIELAGPRLDLDILELVPLVVRRRV